MKTLNFGGQEGLNSKHSTGRVMQYSAFHTDFVVLIDACLQVVT